MPLAIDLFCGLGGWTDGLLAEGYDVVGFDVERHVYGEMAYPAQLVLQDVLTLDGAQFKDATLIVASPPCQEYSYMAMPWSRAKQIAAALRGEPFEIEPGVKTYAFPKDYKGSRTIADLNALFDACFRIQREACEAAGRHIPLVVENVVGAQKWVGPARWRHGSYYLWGDVPALMPIVRRAPKVPGQDWNRYAENGQTSPHWRLEATKNTGGSWFRVAHNTTSGKGRNPDGRNDPRDRPEHTPHMTAPAEHQKGVGAGAAWFDQNHCVYSSGSSRRKAAPAMIAKIPPELARHIARVYREAA